MRTNHAPLYAFLALALGLWAAMAYKPEPAVTTQSPLPGLTLQRFGGTAEAVEWQPAKGTVTLINIFASWCGPCLAEHPHLKELAAIPGVELHGIAWNDQPAALEAWLKKNGNPFTAVWIDATGNAAMNLGLRGVPESFVIDRRGRVRLHIRGSITQASRGKLMALLNQLREEPLRASQP